MECQTPSLKLAEPCSEGGCLGSESSHEKCLFVCRCVLQRCEINLGKVYEVKRKLKLLGNVRYNAKTNSFHKESIRIMSEFLLFLVSSIKVEKRKFFFSQIHMC